MKLADFKQEIATQRSSFQLCFQGVQPLEPKRSTIKLNKSAFHQTEKRHVVHSDKRVCRLYRIPLKKMDEDTVAVLPS